MKNRYIDIMEKSLSAYTDGHIKRYFKDVKTNGLTEHGFPRLTANIGILIAHGRRVDLLPIFRDMMEFCCKTIPTVKAANDFSVREIVCCLEEIEASGIISDVETARWRGYLSTIEPTSCYNKFATSPTDNVRNWALFSCVSEYYRQSAGLCDSAEFIELQVMQQLQWLDENGMYRDNASSDNHQPFVYDLVSRGLFTLLLNRGYRGKYYEEIDGKIKKAALLMLRTQSPNGELPYGGRSNQFLHNEPWMIAVFEYEAKRYEREGNHELAARFKSAAMRALAITESWLSKTPIRHIKNRFPTETSYGCEGYAYFDKYMITVASFAYAAYSICDDTIAFEEMPDVEPQTAVTTEHFHKLFLKGGGYGIEIDVDADPHYDASGVGRVHRVGAPSAICMTCPCPAEPVYKVDIDPMAFSLCAAYRDGDAWLLGADINSKYEILENRTDSNSAFATLSCRLTNGKTAEEHYTVNENGVEISVLGNGDIGYALPAFYFDGESYTDISHSENSLTVTYEGWTCKYVTNGKIIDINKTSANRSGYYRAFLATAKDALKVKIEIVKD